MCRCKRADLSGRAVKAKATWLLGRALESRWGARMVVYCVCCAGSGLCDGLITRSEESYRDCLSVCNCM
jgi:hypothetical protein